MKIEKLPSGSYRVRKTIDGRTYSFTYDHRPTLKEVNESVAEVTVKRPSKASSMRFIDAYGNYIEVKKNILSPSSLRGYKSIITNMPDWFKNLRLRDITKQDFQKLVNDSSASHSPKTVRNISALVSSVLGLYDITLKVTLPQKKAVMLPTPTKDDVETLKKHVKGDRLEPLVWLVTLGLRASEACAVTPDDVDGTNLHISKAIVRGPEEWHIKSTKTTDSDRIIPIPPELAKLIKQGMPEMRPPSLGVAMKRLNKEAGLYPFQPHSYRRFMASYLYKNGFTSREIQDMGGWKSDSVLKSRYIKNLDTENSKKEMLKALENQSEKSCHDNATKNKESSNGNEN